MEGLLASLCRPAVALQPLQEPGFVAVSWLAGRGPSVWVACFREDCSVDSARFLTAGTKAARTTLVSTGMMRENWLPGAPSPLSPLGCRDFFFRHKDSRGSTPPGGWRWSGSSWPAGLLMMNHPTSTHWYHSLPVRKKVLAPRVNLTFRKIRPTTK